ncbi:GNAT family N-acetyltransferase [Sedimentitalea sp. HM32M-2]|uniref:GNAT family N-acetyltransferase n=1 Tax=Sedimentitalea sp. HM32M-2 TaxID=3351566 RepID=UPI003628BEA3
MEILRYGPEHASDWDRFIDRARNGTFLFRRGYMDYHADRFADHSLMAMSAGKLLAVLPANRDGDTLWSHQGLTYGGWICGDKMRAGAMLEVFAAMTDYLADLGTIDRVIYKAVPGIYHRLPSDEDLYALFRSDARLIRRDIATAVVPGARLPVRSGKKGNIKKAEKAGVMLRASPDLAAYHAILSDVLARHDATPVHSLAELELLMGRFPDNIRLYGAYLDDTLVAGSILFVTPEVAHTQYLAASDTGRAIGALDLLLDGLIRSEYADKRYFSFGISTEEGGTVLNDGLIAQKEGFGGTSFVHDFYEIPIRSAG